MRILLIDAHAPTVRTLVSGLKKAEFDVDATDALARGNTLAQTNEYDVILLALFPHDASYAMIQQWRDKGVGAHILVLLPGTTAVAERVRGLDVGADGYLVKPFTLEELLARLRVLARRRQPPSVIRRIHDLEINTETQTVTRGGTTIRLTPQEYELLRFLVDNQGKVVSRAEIREHLYSDTEATSNVVDVYIRYLRAKIDKGFKPPLILTRWGQGYLIRGEVEEPEE